MPFLNRLCQGTGAMVRHLRKDLVHVLFHRLRRSSREMEGFVGSDQRRDDSYYLQTMSSCMKATGEWVVGCRPYMDPEGGPC